MLGDEHHQRRQTHNRLSPRPAGRDRHQVHRQPRRARRGVPVPGARPVAGIPNHPHPACTLQGHRSGTGLPQHPGFRRKALCLRPHGRFYVRVFFKYNIEQNMDILARNRRSEKEHKVSLFNIIGTLAMLLRNTCEREYGACFFNE